LRYLRRALGLTWPAASVTVAVTLASLLVIGGLAADAPPAAAAITGMPIYWGTYISNAPADTRLIDAFEAAVGKKESIVHWGQPWYNGGTAQTFQASRFNSVRTRGSIPMVTWGSWDRANGSKDQPDFRLATIASGKYDNYITQWAKDAKAWGHPFFLRFDIEMNGDWQFPWAEKINGNKAGDFVKAWRHVHDIFTNVGATNATWVWCPNVSGTKTTPMKELWPGANYADWTCLDGYNGAGSQNQAWLTFTQVFNGAGVKGRGNSYDEVESIAPGKPVMIGETSTSEKGGSKPDWITSALTSELPGSFPGVQAVVWTDWNAGDPNLDWPIDSSPASLSAFARAIASPLFASNGYGDLSVAPIPAANRIQASQPAAAAAAAPPPAPAPDPRYFDATHFRIDDDRIWGYFQARGGLDVFGYPVSRTFTLLGCQSQIFQREVAQVCSDGSPRLLNLLDPDIFPYTQVNGSTLPDVDEDLKSQTPTLDDPNYASDMLGFVSAEAPDSYAGQPVNFGSTFFSLITPDMAGVDGPLLGLINLEVWGAPISQPMVDPGNSNFIYQRFQRGIMHYDATTGVTRGLLLADYLKAVITGQNVPGDLADQAAGGALYQQYCPGMARSLCRPDELPGTDLTSAFDPE
jgi:beta-mannanase